MRGKTLEITQIHVPFPSVAPVVQVLTVFAKQRHKHTAGRPEKRWTTGLSLSV